MLNLDLDARPDVIVFSSIEIPRYGKNYTCSILCNIITLTSIVFTDLLQRSMGKRVLYNIIFTE